MHLLFLSRFIMSSFSSLQISRVRKIMKSGISFDVYVFPSSRLSAWNNSAPTDRIFMTAYIIVFFLKPVNKTKFH